VNFAIAAGLFGLGAIGLFDFAAPATIVDAFALNLLFVNLGLAIFNLITAFPMDGGRVLRAALSGWMGRVPATEIAAGLGRTLAVIFGIYCLFKRDVGSGVSGRLHLRGGRYGARARDR